jgi:hypothetical protein
VLLTKVEELLNPGSGTWDEDLVRDVFWEEDVRYILATLTNPGHDDFLAWHFDRRGLLSVKSAYHVLDDEKHQVKINRKVKVADAWENQTKAKQFGEKSGNFLAHQRFGTLYGAGHVIVWL